jgi:RNA polymerase sigma factor (sigma-70 family)
VVLVDRSEETDLVRRAVRGEPRSIRTLVAYITPTINGVIQRYLGAMARSARIRDRVQNRDELYQEVMLELFAKDAGVLVRFDSDKATLKRYVGRVASHVCYTRVQRRQPDIIDEPMNPEISGEPSIDLASKADARLLLQRLYTQLTREVSPDELRLFRLLIVEERSHEEVSQLTGISKPNLHVRKSRLRSRAQKLLTKLLKDNRPNERENRDDGQPEEEDDEDPARYPRPIGTSESQST